MLKYAERRAKRENAAVDMISNLDRTKLAYLYRKFQENKNGMDVVEFIRSEIDINSNSSSGIELDHIDKIVELFKEIDVNGDETMEWNEFTKFISDKALAFASKQNGSSIDEYRQKDIQVSGNSSKSKTISKMIRVPARNRLAITESQQPIIWILDGTDCSSVAHIILDSVPLCMRYMVDDHCIVTGCSDMTLAIVSLDDAKPSHRYKVKSVWPTPCAQYSVAWCEEYNKLFSGGVDGRIICWNVDSAQEQQTQASILQGHCDTVSDLCVMPVLGQVISSSLDTTIGIWDIITSTKTHELRGHRKAINFLSYCSPKRIICSAGSDHHANLWSPFMSRPIARLEGHESGLIGCEIAEHSPEVITADTDGIIKIWDLRTFRCVQSLSTLGLRNQSGKSNNPSEQLTPSLSAFIHMSLSPASLCGSSNTESGDGRGRIFAATRHLLLFDQFRSKVEVTTCDTTIRWVTFNSTNMTIAVGTDKEIEIWDGTTGTLRSKFTNTVPDGLEISSFCLDDRKRKLILGDTGGTLYILNYRTGGLMKSINLYQREGGDILSTLYQSSYTNSVTRLQKRIRKQRSNGDGQSAASGMAIICMVYLEETRSIIIGLADSTVRVISEADPEICSVVRQFDNGYKHSELLSVKVSKRSKLALTIGCDAEEGIRAWDLLTGKCELTIHVALPRQLRLKQSSASSMYGFESLSHGFNCIGTDGIDDEFSIEEITMLDPLELIAVTSSDNRIMVFGCVGTYWEGLKLFSFHNKLDSTYKLVIETVPRQEEKTLHHNHPRIVVGQAGDGFSLMEASELSEVCHLAAVTCIGWCKERYDLYVGDDAGFLTKWNITQANRKLDAAVKRNWEESDGVRQSEGVFRPLESISRRSALIPQIQSSDVVLQWKAKAHSRRCTRIEVTEKLGLLITCGEDRCVHLWDCNGKILGVLLQAATSGSPNLHWQLPKRLDDLCETEMKEIAVLRNYVLGTTVRTGGLSECTSGLLSEKLSKTIRVLGLDMDETDLESLSSSGSKQPNSSYCFVNDLSPSLSRVSVTHNSSKNMAASASLKQRRSKSLNNLGKKVLDLMNKLDTAIDNSQLIS